MTQRDFEAGQDRPKLTFRPPKSSRPGVRVDVVELGSSSAAPFNGSRFSVEPGCASRIDSHADHELWMVARGEGELVYDGQSLRIRPGDVLYFEPPKTHGVHNDGAESLLIFSFWWGGDER